MTTTAPLVRDEVWAQLPQRRLPRIRVVGALAALLALGLAVLALVQFGVVVPRISVDANGYSTGPGHTVEAEFTLTNDGARPVRLTKVLVPAPWLTVTRVSARPAGRYPGEIPSRGYALVTVELTITDCAAVPRAGAPLVLSVSGPVVDSTLTMHPHGDTDPKAPGSYSYTGKDPWELGWLSLPAQEACGLVDRP
ncbi:MAG: hypothetical protein ACTHNT_03405 [Actinomycetales bacterium]